LSGSGSPGRPPGPSLSAGQRTAPPPGGRQQEGRPSVQDDILVVGDGEALRRRVGRELGAAGFPVRTAGCEEAWEAFRRLPPAAVVGELARGGEAGLAWLRRVRSASPVPVVLVAARADVPAAVAAMHAGASDVLAYPDELDRLVSEVGRALAAPRAPSVAELRRRRSQGQREELVRMLAECGGNLAAVGRRLGLSRGAVFYRARKFGLLPGRGERG